MYRSGEQFGSRPFHHLNQDNQRNLLNPGQKFFDILEKAISQEYHNNKINSGGNITTISNFLKLIRAHGGCLGSERR